MCIWGPNGPGNSRRAEITSVSCGPHLTQSPAHHGAHSSWWYSLTAEGCWGQGGMVPFLTDPCCPSSLLLAPPPQPSSAAGEAATTTPTLRPVPTPGPAAWWAALAALGPGRPGPREHAGETSRTPKTSRARAPLPAPQPGKLPDKPRGPPPLSTWEKGCPCRLHPAQRCLLSPIPPHRVLGLSVAHSATRAVVPLTVQL